MTAPHVTHRFDSPAVLKFTESVIETWYPSERPILFVPCAKSKPIQNSRSHKQLFHRFQDCCEMLIISEPMTVIPYSFFDYPAYEYPPFGELRGKLRNSNTDLPVSYEEND